MCPMWKGLAMLGELNSTMTVFPPPSPEPPKRSASESTSERTSLVKNSLLMNMLRKAFMGSMLSNSSAPFIFSASSAAIRGGALRISFASLKHGKA